MQCRIRHRHCLTPISSNLLIYNFCFDHTENTRPRPISSTFKCHSTSRNYWPHLTTFFSNTFFSKAYTPCYRTFIASYYFFFIMELLVLKINLTDAVPDPAPTLLDSNFLEPANLQLLFRPSGKYAALTHFIHI